MLNRLTRRMRHIGRVFVHIDKGRPIALDHALAEDPNITVTSVHDVHWGHWSIVLATEHLAEQAMREGCTRLTLLSGACYPLVSDDRLLRLAEDPSDYVDAHPVTAGEGLDRLRRRHLFPPFKRNRFLVGAWHVAVQRLAGLLPTMEFETLLHPLQARRGSQFWSVRRETYLAAQKEARSRPELRQLFSRIFCSDECYFQTLFAHVSPRHINRGITYVKWGARGAPDPITVDDVDRHAGKGEYFFIRKICSSDTAVLERLEKLRH